MGAAAVIDRHWKAVDGGLGWHELLAGLMSIGIVFVCFHLGWIVGSLRVQSVIFDLSACMSCIPTLPAVLMIL